MASDTTELQHAALWLIGPDMPGLLKLGARFVADRGGNINKDIADKFGEKAVVFMSISAAPDDIARMEREKEKLEFASGVGVVFQPMNEPTVPEGYQDDLYGFDVITDDAPGLVAKLTRLAEEFGLLLVGHTGELRVVGGLTPLVQAGQKFVVMLPEEFDHHGFTKKLNGLVEKHNGVVQTPLRPVLGLLWW